MGELLSNFYELVASIWECDELATSKSSPHHLYTHSIHGPGNPSFLGPVQLSALV